jgi:hypothetical protein
MHPLEQLSNHIIELKLFTAGISLPLAQSPIHVRLHNKLTITRPLKAGNPSKGE